MLSFMTINQGKGGLQRVVVNGPQSSAEIYLHGAHLTHFQPRDAQPVLFMSAESNFDPAKPIRGGVPLIFPWFGPKAGSPDAPMHGFARLKTWSLHSTPLPADRSVDVALGLQTDDAELRMLFNIGPRLRMELEVRANRDFSFEEAFHTYFVVGDVRQVEVDGLQNTEYIDKMDSFKRKTQPAETIRIAGETDRVFQNARGTVRIIDPVLKRTIVIEKEGSASTVVWNPWIAKAKAMADFGDDEWPGMICVETANVGDHAIRLAAGETHTMRATIGLTS